MAGSGFERTRQHRVVTRHDAPPPERIDEFDQFDELDEMPFEDDGFDAWVQPEPVATGPLGVDSRLLRVGAIAAVAVLAVPIALALRQDGSNDEVRAVPSTVTTTIPALNPPGVSAVPVTAGLAVTPASAPAVDDADDDDASSSESDDDAAAAVAQEEEAPECAGTYTVVAGDYWIRFVDSSGASLDEWLAANDAAPDTELHVGDELCIPAGAQAPAQTVAETAPPEAPTPPTEAAPQPAVAAAPETTSPPPPPPPPPPAPVVTDAPRSVATTDEVQAMIREIWPDDIEERALQIAYNEAKWRPDLNNWCCYGVFALYFKYVPADLKAAYGVDEPADLYDARTNISIAYQIYLRSGWAPWSQTDPGG